MKATSVIPVCLLLSALARGSVLVTTAHLSGPAESPPVDSPGTGFTIVTYDSDAHTLRVQVTFSGLLGNTTVSHIHAPTPEPFTQTASVATQTPTFADFPAGVTSGSYDHTFDLTQASSYRAGFITDNGGTPAGAEAALIGAIQAGKAYLNIHSSLFGSGEIRGFLEVDADADGVPDADDACPNDPDNDADGDEVCGDVDAFPDSRDVGGHVLIEGCDTGVDNVVFPDGSTISDLIYQIAGGARNHGQFVSGVADLTNGLRKEGILTAHQAAAIRSCAGKSGLARPGK